MTDPFSPVKIGPIEVANRFIRSGANEMMTKDCVPTKSLVEFHRRLAVGGVGLSTVAYISVSADGRTFTDQGILNDETVPHYRAVTDAIHAGGALASAQITHGGSMAQHDELSTPRAMSASGGLDKVGMMRGRFLQHQMNRADMDQVIGEFVTAARLAVAAGFDAIELHMGHGYLMSQFISPLSNKRKDQYGQTAEGRVRYPAEVAAAVKQAVGDKVAILAKINLFDGVKGGATVDDAIVTARAMEKAGVDMLVLSGGRNVEAPWWIFSGPLPFADFAAMPLPFATRLQFKLLKAITPKSVKFSELYFLEAAQKVRKAVKCQLGYVGGVLSLDAAQKVLNLGFDAIVMARALVHEPNLVKRFKDDPSCRSGCTACNRCVAAMYGPAGTYCPETGNMIDPALNKIPAGVST